MRAALGVLRWSPDAMWRATPRELAAALAPAAPAIRPLSAGELAALAAAFPDEPGPYQETPS